MQININQLGTNKELMEVISMKKLVKKNTQAFGMVKAYKGCFCGGDTACSITSLSKQTVNSNNNAAKNK